MIIVVGGIKGGSGKTTIATNLAVMRSLNGKKVLLVDADEQFSASIFANQREASNIETSFTTIPLGGKHLHLQILRMKDDYDDIIIDVGGRDTTSQRSALSIADIYLMPYFPGSIDVWTVSLAKQLVIDMTQNNRKLRSYAFINRADPEGQGSDNNDALNILQEYEEWECLPFKIGNRKVFRHSSADGLSIVEWKAQNKEAIQEMHTLYQFIFSDGQKSYKNNTLGVHLINTSNTRDVQEMFDLNTSEV